MSRLFLLGAMDKMSIFVILQEGVYMNTMAIFTKPQYHGLIFRVKIISFLLRLILGEALNIKLDINIQNIKAMSTIIMD